MSTTLLKKNHPFLLSNTVWIYLVLLLFISYLLNISIVKETLGNYLAYVGVLYLLYWPTLLFAAFRKSLHINLSPFFLSLLWSICFVIYPFCLFYFRDYLMVNLFPLSNYQYSNVDISAFHYSFLLTVNVAILATELLILYSDHLLGFLQEKRWFKLFNLDKMMLLVAGLVSIFFAGWATDDLLISSDSKLFTALKAMGLFVVNLLQVGLIAVGYYLFYYVNRHYLIPQILSKKGLIYFSFATIGFILIAYPVFIKLVQWLPVVQDLQIEMFLHHPFAQDRAGMPLLIILFSMPIIIVTQWYEQNNQIIHLEKEKTTTELNLLKQQINPHFFFNTLNNLYALSIVKDRQTPEVILQLSEMMRYVIYRGKEESVALKEEVKYIEDYVQLQQIRLHKQLDFRFEKEIEDDTLAIPPLLFVTFVENAFKHGIEPAEKDCFLHLSLKSTANALTFSCQNSFEDKNTAPPGIGLANLRRRMALRFPDKHQIELSATTNTYTARLAINNLRS